MEKQTNDPLVGQKPRAQRSPKLGERIASEIANRIVSDGLPIGSPLGIEADLLAQYGSSRCTIREALAILEREGVVNVRRGRGGGIFVAPTDMDGLGHAMRAHLEYLDVGFEEIFLARRVLNPLALRLACQRMDRTDVQNLRQKGIRFWAVRKATKNPILDIFSRSAARYELLCLARSDIPQSEYLKFLNDNLKILGHQAEVLIGGNIRTALDLQEEIIEKGESFVERMMSVQRQLSHAELVERLEQIISPRRPLKKPEEVTYSLLNEIAGAGWETGLHLGSEPELISRFGVGRSAFREAIRPMEQYGIVEMRTGRQSGLKIASPTAERVIDEFSRRFKSLGFPLESYTEVYNEIGGAIVALAATNGGKDRLGAAGAGGHSVTGGSAAARLNAHLASGAGNRILAIMLKILATAVGSVPEDASGAHEVVDAIQASDPALAYRSFVLMRAHAQAS